MKRILITISALLILSFCQLNFAAGLLFNVTSHGSTLSITTTIPSHVYPNAGIKVNTPGYGLTNSGKDCTPDRNGYCLFAVSNTLTKTISISGATGTANITLCLNGKGPVSCQNYNVNINACSGDLIPPIQGSFENSTLANNGWLTTNEGSGVFSIYHAGDTILPLGHRSILFSPPCGNQAVISDQNGPASNILYRDIVLPNISSSCKITLSFKVANNNERGQYFTPQSLHVSSSPNQQVRVDIIKPTLDPFTMNSSDILLNAFQTVPGITPVRFPYTTVTVDLPAALLGQTIRLRLAQVDTEFFQQAYFDCVTMMIQPK